MILKIIAHVAVILAIFGLSVGLGFLFYHIFNDIFDHKSKARRKAKNKKYQPKDK